MSSAGAAPRAAAPVSNARAEASRRNGAKSGGPKSPEGKARSAQNALKHGLRAQKFVVLPDEDAAEFAALEATMMAELAPVGALQAVLARQVAVAAWRLARADRLEAELFAERRWDGAGVGVALIRDGNGTRSFETIMRYRGAAMAEFWRALRTLKALQAEQAAAELPVPAPVPAVVRAQSSRYPPSPSAPRTPLFSRPNEPEPRPGSRPQRRLEYVLPAPLAPGHTLHEPAAPWMPDEAGPDRDGDPAANGAPARARAPK